MSQTLRTLGLAALIAASASAFMTTNAFALSSHDCSVLFKAAKAANTDGGLTYKDFRTAKCSADAAVAPAVPAVPAVPAAPAAKMTKAAAPAAPAAPAVAVVTSGSFMKDCSVAWKGMKAANTVPVGMTFKDFVVAKCVVAGAPMAPAAKGAAAATAPAVVVAPKMTKVAAPTEPTAADEPVKTVDKNGKAFTPGQIAFYQHEKLCGAQWRGLATKPVGMKWPQYLSACHKQLKAAGK